MLVLAARQSPVNAAETEPPRRRLALLAAQPLFAHAVTKLLQSPPLNANVTLILSSTEEDTGPVDLVIRERHFGGRVSHLASGSDGAPPPTILLFDTLDTVEALRALRDGVRGVLTKAATEDQLVMAVSTVLAGHRILTDDVADALLADVESKAAGFSGLESVLTPAEVAILELIAQAKSVAAIATARGITRKTVRNHLARIYRKIDVQSRTEAMLYAARFGLMTPPSGEGSGNPDLRAAIGQGTYSS